MNIDSIDINTLFIKEMDNLSIALEREDELLVKQKELMQIIIKKMEYISACISMDIDYSETLEETIYLIKQVFIISSGKIDIQMMCMEMINELLNCTE